MAAAKTKVLLLLKKGQVAQHHVRHLSLVRLVTIFTSLSVHCVAGGQPQRRAQVQAGGGGGRGRGVWHCKQVRRQVREGGGLRHR